MKAGFQVMAGLLGIVGLFLGVGFLTADWERPPVNTTQIGYRGLGMEQVDSLSRYAEKAASVTLPAAQDPAEPGGQLASQAYENVKVLGNLTENEFNRLMLNITEWVSPEQGCEYCHNPEKMADDSKYTKIVARRMLQMTKTINATWSPHVAATGVTCYTCHRGHPVPQQIWYQAAEEARSTGMLGYKAGQNMPAASAGLTSLPYDPFTDKLGKAGNIRVVSTRALPTTSSQAGGIKAAEATYALMVNMSEALGVNCTYCHNSRQFASWEQSHPARVTAWHGIRMVQALNASYLDPLKGTVPPARLGPMGDAPKLFCATCHQGLAKPLNGAQLLADNPELNKVPAE